MRMQMQKKALTERENPQQKSVNRTTKAKLAAQCKETEHVRQSALFSQLQVQPSHTKAGSV